VQKPSAKNIIFIASAAAIIGVAFFVSKHENGAYSTSSYDQSQNSIMLPILTASATSSDQNNINYGGNWEKTLSTSVSGSWGNSTSSSATSSAPLTPTDVFSHDFFTRYAQAKNSGADLTDPNVQQAIADKVLSDGTVLQKPHIYTQSDLKISSDNSSAAIKTYGNAAGLVFAEYFIKHQNEMDIIQSSLNDNNPTELKQLDPIIAEYQGLMQGELAVTVPASVASFHLALVNAFSELTFADQSFEKTFSDGLTSLNGLGSYQQGASDLNDALNGIETYLAAGNITYTTQEPGIIFTYKPK
jgi:hypothetical protein